MSDAYDPELQDIVDQTAKKLSIQEKIRKNGTYCFVSGPTYESRAECKFLRSIGGDSVGMSTIPEVITAKHCGMRILGLSLITNKVVTEVKKNTVHATHAEVLAAVQTAGKNVEAIVKTMMPALKSYISKLPEPSYNVGSKKPKSPNASYDMALNTTVSLLGFAAILTGVIMVLKRK